MPDPLLERLDEILKAFSPTDELRPQLRALMAEVAIEYYVESEEWCGKEMQRMAEMRRQKIRQRFGVGVEEKTDV